LKCQKYSLKRESGTKSPVKLTWSKKMNVLSTFLESSLILRSNNLKNTVKLCIVSEKSVVKV